MVVTKEVVQERLEALKKQAEKLQADLNATVGAVQDCNYWLAQLEKPDGGDIPQA